MEIEWNELDNQDFAKRMAVMAMADDPNNLDWVPARLHDKKGKLYLTCIHKYQLRINSYYPQQNV